MGLRRILGPATGFSIESSTPVHQCNCIGCCERCGQCRTSPWHLATCDEIASLREAQRKVIERAQQNVTSP